MADKISVAVQSVNGPNGKQTIVQTALDAGAAVPPHYYTLFNEAF